MHLFEKTPKSKNNKPPIFYHTAKNTTRFQPAPEKGMKGKKGKKGKSSNSTPIGSGNVKGD